MSDADLLAAVVDIEAHTAAAGWDQPPALFALVPTATVVAERPELAKALGLAADGPALTTFEQSGPPAGTPLDEFLAHVAWPEPISGAAIVVERIVLPPQVEAELSAQEDPTAVARTHPEAREMRIAVAVQRDGASMCALRLRGEESVVTGPDLVPGLVRALVATFR